MSDDLLDRATRALARETDAAADHGDATLTGILDALEDAETKRVPQRRRAFVGWAAAAALALAIFTGGPTAWAWSVEVVRSMFVPADPAPTEPAPVDVAAPVPTVPRPLSAAPTSPTPLPPEALPLAPPSPAPSVTPEPTRAGPPEATPLRSHARGSRANGASPAPAPLEEPSLDPAVRAERELFERAHRLHFGGAGREAALGAWNDYLGAYPDGRYVPEARYNRALTLVRLGRMAAARRALEDLSRVGYRTSEVRALLEATAP